ncbi:MAG: response regulator [Candidatus Eremiobacterota bacterium]
MRFLIVDDEITSRKILQKSLKPYGSCDFAVNGAEAITFFKKALEEECPYDLICMDIMMPNIDGQQAVKEIRKLEKEKGIKPKKEVKIIMVTALGDPKNAVEAFYHGKATSYLVKPISVEKLLGEVKKFGLIPEA